MATAIVKNDNFFNLTNDATPPQASAFAARGARR